MEDIKKVKLNEVLKSIFYPAAWVISGISSWQWIEPNNFGGYVLFILTWFIIGIITQMFTVLILVGIEKVLKL